MFIICKFNHLWKKKLFTSLYSYLLPKSWEKYRPVYEVEFEWIMINYPEFYRFKEIFHINVSYQILRCSCFSWPDYYQIPEISLINIIPQIYNHEVIQISKRNILAISLKLRWIRIVIAFGAITWMIIFLYSIITSTNNLIHNSSLSASFER